MQGGKNVGKITNVKNVKNVTTVINVKTFSTSILKSKTKILTS